MMTQTVAASWVSEQRFHRTGVVPERMSQFPRKRSSAMKFLLDVPRPFSGMLVTASCHAFTDVYYPVRKLCPYGLLFLYKTLPPDAITVMFAMASVHHFGLDVGWKNSVLLHTVLALLAFYRFRIASTAMAMYYLFVHVPKHVVSTWNASRHAAAICIATVSVCGAFLPEPRTFSLNEWMQTLVVAHVLCNAYARVNEWGGGSPKK